jgi:hypothetical protein
MPILGAFGRGNVPSPAGQTADVLHPGACADAAFQTFRQLTANHLLARKADSLLPSICQQIRGYQRYQNEYQTALDRNLPDKTATPRFLEKPQKKTVKTGQKCPIPTLASIR